MNHEDFKLKMETEGDKFKVKWKGGYRGIPGAGAEGETCKSCHNCYGSEYNGKKYYKCKLVPETHGTGTDIRLKAPACEFWKKLAINSNPKMENRASGRI